MAGYDCRLVSCDLACFEGDVTDAELREKIERLRFVYIAHKVVEVLELLLDRIERIENHLHDKFGEQP